MQEVTVSYYEYVVDRVAVTVVEEEEHEKEQ